MARLRVVLGLNGCFGRRSRDAPLDLSNARAVLDATAASAAGGDGHAFGFELGNELSECAGGTQGATDRGFRGLT
jgi:hypothetical protein